MTIEEIKAAKWTLEQRIRAQVSEFETATRTEVTNIRLVQTYEVTRADGTRISDASIEITAEVPSQRSAT